MIDDKELLVQELADSQKLNKQKRTLRILNVLTALLLILAVVIVPISFSRYSSTVACESSTNIAGIGVDIDYNYEMIGKNGMSVVKGKTHIIIKEFTITNNSDVSLQYNLSIKLASSSSYDYNNTGALSYSTFVSSTANSSDLYIVNSSNTGFTQLNDRTNPFSNVVPGKTINTSSCYYAFSTDGTNWTWYQETPTNGKQIDFTSIDQSKKTLNYGSNTIHHYKVVVFVKSNGTELENSNILYNVTSTQVD